MCVCLCVFCVFLLMGQGPEIKWNEWMNKYLKERLVICNDEDIQMVEIGWQQMRSGFYLKTESRKETNASDNLDLWPFDPGLINHMTSSKPHPHSITLIIHNNRSWPVRPRIPDVYPNYIYSERSFYKAACPDCTLSTHPSVLTGSLTGQLPKLLVIIGHGPFA